MLLHVILVVVGFLFVLDFPLRKPSLKMILTMIAVVAITVCVIAGFTRMRLPDHRDKSNQIIEAIMEEMEETYETEAP